MGAMLICTMLIFVLSYAHGQDFEYTISVDHALDGFIMKDVKVNDRVNLVRHVQGRRFLQIHVVSTNVNSPHHKRNTTNLEDGLEFQTRETWQFAVDDDGFVFVCNISGITLESHREFYVQLVNTSRNEVVSNPAPLVVEIRDLPAEANNKAVILAGVLLVFIVLANLLIPFVVRTKRRRKQGKPIFGCGRSDSTDSVPDKLRKIESVASISFDTQVSTDSSMMEPHWFGREIGYNYQEELAIEADTFTSDILNIAKHTHKNRHRRHSPQVHDNKAFQWLDVHYSEEEKPRRKSIVTLDESQNTTLIMNLDDSPAESVIKATN
ncbi:hypothetical protein ScPMuIL_008525 [Solemya velum]